MLESLFNKVAGLQSCNFIKKRLQHSCSHVNIAKFLRTPFFTEYLQLLNKFGEVAGESKLLKLNCFCFSSQADTIINILIDVNGFLTYENRELLVLEDNDDVI